MYFDIRRSAAATILTMAACFPATAADLIVTNASLFDGTGRDLVYPASIVIEDGRVKRVEIGASTTDAPIIVDAGGKTVMPGLINGHFHLFFDLYSTPHQNFANNDEQAREYMRGKLPETLKSHLEQGVTALFSPIDFWPHIFDVRERVASGEILGPRVFVGGQILAHSGDHYACASSASAEGEWCNRRMVLYTDTPQEARTSVQRMIRDGADLIVFDATTNQPALQKESLLAMVDEAHQHGLRIVAHNADARDVPAMVEAGVDGFVHPPGVTRDLDGSLMSALGERGLPIEITLGFYQRLIAQGHASEANVAEYETLLNNVTRALEAGAVPIFASDMPGLPPEEVVPTVIRVMSGVGLDNKTILLSATRNAARDLLGQEDLGTIEPGKIADLIMVDGDPLSDLSALTRVELVIKDGRIVSDRREEAQQQR